MTHRVHVNGPTWVDTDLGGATIGAAANALAYEHQVVGTHFTLKVDGEVAPRRRHLESIPDGAVLELVEASDENTPDVLAEPATAEQPVLATDPPAPPETEATPARRRAR